MEKRTERGEEENEGQHIKRLGGRLTISIVRRGIRDGGREGGMEGRRGGCMSYFLQVAINEWTDTNPVLSPPAALNSGAFQ